MESFSLNVTPEKLYCTSLSTGREISPIKGTEYTNGLSQQMKHWLPIQLPTDAYMVTFSPKSDGELPEERV